MLPDNRASFEQLRPFAAIELVVLDIDGTLIAAANEPVGVLAQKLYRTLSSGYSVRITIATGRAFGGAAPIIDALGVTNPVVLYNGAIVADRGGAHLLFRKSIDADTVRQAVALAVRAGASALVYNCRPSPPQQTLPGTGAEGPGLIETVTGWSRGLEPVREVNGLHVEWQPADAPVIVSEATAVLVMCSDPESHLPAALQRLPHVSATSSGAGYAELRPAGVSKAIGVEYLARHLGISRANVLAIGDNDNDVEMLDWAGIGVAVHGATQRAVQACDYTTTQRSASGVIEILRVVEQARRFGKRGGYRVTGPT